MCGHQCVKQTPFHSKWESMHAEAQNYEQGCSVITTTNSQRDNSGLSCDESFRLRKRVVSYHVEIQYLGLVCRGQLLLLRQKYLTRGQRTNASLIGLPGPPTESR